MKKSILKIVLTALIFLPFWNVSSQTLFARPDTSPDYASYRNVEDCLAAIKRLKEFAVSSDSIWEDTVTLDTRKAYRPLPDEVVRYAGECLSRVDIDTIPLVAMHEYAGALLVANRDADVERLYGRYADSIYADSTHSQFMHMLTTYMNAQPVRMERVRSLYEVGLSRLPSDSVVSTLTLHTVVGAVSSRAGDYSIAHTIAREMLDIMDTLPASVRRSSRYIAMARGMYFPYISSLLMLPDAVDSLAVSTQAYRNWMVGIGKTIFGYEPTQEIGPIGLQAPELTGKWWYSSHNGEIRSVQPQAAIEKGKVTIIYFLQAGCHANYQEVPRGRSNGVPASCWKQLHRVRKIINQHPEINLVVVSRTFGSIGDAPPLTPDQEADTLAQYFLGFHGLKGLHVIEETGYVRLSEYDERKIDSETPNELAYTFDNMKLNRSNAVVLVDEKGEIFHYLGLLGQMEYPAMEKLATIMNREANRGGR